LIRGVYVASQVVATHREMHLLSEEWFREPCHCVRPFIRRDTNFRNAEPADGLLRPIQPPVRCGLRAPLKPLAVLCYNNNDNNNNVCVCNHAINADRHCLHQFHVSVFAFTGPNGCDIATSMRWG
jgi:hypothetical protein